MEIRAQNIFLNWTNYSCEVTAAEIKGGKNGVESPKLGIGGVPSPTWLSRAAPRVREDSQASIQGPPWPPAEQLWEPGQPLDSLRELLYCLCVTEGGADR